MERDRLTALTHRGVPFANPLSERAVDELVAELGLAPGGRVVDVGCGNGEMLRRVLEAHDAHGLGIDPSPHAIAAARERLGDRADLRQITAGELRERDFDAAINVGSSHAYGTWLDALGALSRLVRPGGEVLLGEGFWMRPPPHPYLDALGASAGELPDLAGLVAGAAAQGLVTVRLAVATQEDWDRYEWRLIANGERAADALQEQEPESAAALRAWVGAARERVLGEGGRDTLGFALLALRRG